MWGSLGKASSNLNWNQGLHLHKHHKIEWILFDLGKNESDLNSGKEFSEQKLAKCLSHRERIFTCLMLPVSKHNIYSQQTVVLVISVSNCMIVLFNQAKE